MGRLIEIQPALQPLPSRVTVRVGDMLTIAATGGDCQSDEAPVECLGTFLSSVVGDDGQVFTPAGPPNTVLFLARRPGTATLRIVIGDPLGTPQSRWLDVRVEA